MTQPRPLYPSLGPRPAAALAAGLLLLLTLLLQPAQAAKADRDKPTVLNYDRAGLDLVKQRTELGGNVVLSKGSMMLRAEHMDVREASDGYYQAYASGVAGKPVIFKQARDEPGEYIEGSAEQVEYDARSDTMRFIGNAVMRRMRGTAVMDEVMGAVLHYDNRAEVFSFESSGANAQHPAGRGRTVIMPRYKEEAASAPAGAASSGLVLQPSLLLQPRGASSSSPGRGNKAQ